MFPPKRAKSGHLTTIAVKFRQTRAKAGLPKNLILYCGRHDFDTRAPKKRGNLKLVMQTMGQKDVKTAMKYQHPELDIVRTALNETAPGCSNWVRRRYFCYGTLYGTPRFLRFTTTGK